MNNGGIGVPLPEDHLLDLALDLIYPHSEALPSLRYAPQQLLHLLKGVEDGDVGRGHSSLPSRLCGRGPGRSSRRRQKDGIPPLLFFPNIPYSFNNSPSLPGSLQGPNFSLIFFDSHFL